MSNKLLNGEIVWYGGEIETSITFLTGSISENLIRLYIEPSQHVWGYDVTLNRRETGTIFEGSYIRSNDGGSDRVTCEIFRSIEGRDKFVLHGKWFEDVQYFWYAKFHDNDFR